METYKLATENGIQFGFEIENVYISMYKIAKILSIVNGISNIKRRKLFYIYDDDEYRLGFDFNGEAYLILEPFGDNSRYWIVPKDSENYTSRIADIEEIFRQYQPSILIKIIGDLISLKPISFVIEKIRHKIKPKES